MARVVYVVCMCARREVLEGVGGSALKCCLVSGWCGVNVSWHPPFCLHVV